MQLTCARVILGIGGGGGKQLRRELLIAAGFGEGLFPQLARSSRLCGKIIRTSRRPSTGEAMWRFVVAFAPLVACVRAEGKYAVLGSLFC